MPRIIPEFTMWFDVPAEQGPGRVEIIDLSDGDISNISLKATVIRTIYQPGAPPRQEGSHQLSKDADLTICRAIKDWEGFEDEDGKDIPCIDANKLLFTRQGWFRPFITDCRIKVKKAADVQREEQVKN